MQKTNRVIITCSSIPPRFDTLVEVLRHYAKEQTRTPDSIVVNIPERYYRFADRDIEADVQRLYELLSAQGLGPLVSLPRSSRDYGPATKLIPTLLREMSEPMTFETIILTVDDDVIPESHAVAELLSMHERFSDSVLGFMGTDVNGRFVHGEQLTEIGRDSHPAVGLGGYRIIAYPWSVIGKHVQALLDDFRLVEADGGGEMPLDDDMLFSCWLTRCNIRRLIVRTEFVGPHWPSYAGPNGIRDYINATLLEHPEPLNSNANHGTMLASHERIKRVLGAPRAIP